MNHTFTAPVAVWLSDYSLHDADTLQKATDIKGITVLEPNFNPGDGYTRVGVGEITITIATKDEIMAGKVESLRAELAKDRANSQLRQNALIRKIGELEALSYEPSAI
jgi:hypothetical protein